KNYEETRPRLLEVRFSLRASSARGGLQIVEIRLAAGEVLLRRRIRPVEPPIVLPQAIDTLRPLAVMETRPILRNRDHPGGGSHREPEGRHRGLRRAKRHEPQQQRASESGESKRFVRHALIPP